METWKIQKQILAGEFLVEIEDYSAENQKYVTVSGPNDLYVTGYAETEFEAALNAFFRTGMDGIEAYDCAKRVLSNPDNIVRL